MTYEVQTLFYPDTWENAWVNDGDESPVQFECIVKEVIELGTEGGAGNLVICEVVQIHINEAVLDGNGMIDQHKIDLVARMG